MWDNHNFTNLCLLLLLFSPLSSPLLSPLLSSPLLSSPLLSSLLLSYPIHSFPLLSSLGSSYLLFSPLLAPLVSSFLISSPILSSLLDLSSYLLSSDPQISIATFVGLQPTVIASRAPHLLLEQSVKIQRIVDVHRPSIATFTMIAAVCRV